MRHASGSASPELGAAAVRRVLVAGFSTRAIAESAARAGFLVASVDAFGDLDHRATPATALGRDHGLAYRPHALVRAARDLPGDAFSYVASLENHPATVAELTRGRMLWGNPPAVLRRARNPILVARLLRAHGLPALAARRHPPRDPAISPRRWLIKPMHSGGGHGITHWRPGQPIRRMQYLQEYADGPSGSFAFVADGRSAVPFACTRQLIGDPAFGASGFRYCGNLLALPVPLAHGDAFVETAAAIAGVLVRELHLVGVNGFDFVVRDGVPFLTELNPRHSASMELAERAFGFPVFGAHAAACQGTLPSFDLAAALRDRRGVTGVIGKAVLFARRAITAGETHRWLGTDVVRDVPHPGERIARGSPVCTIFARGARPSDCHAALVRTAQRMYEEIGGRGRRSA